MSKPLADLDATFVTLARPSGYYQDVEALADADGVMFWCPKCEGNAAHVVLCWFRGKVPDNVSPGPGRWEPSGMGIGDLTLHPSVNLESTCGWHGFVTTGSAA